MENNNFELKKTNENTDKKTKLLEEMESEINSNFIEAEQEIGQILKEEEAGSNSYIKTNNVFKKLREKVSNRIATIFAVGVISVGGGEKISAENIQNENDYFNKSEIIKETKSNDLKSDTYIMSSEERPIKKDNSKKENSTEKIRFDITTSFELGNAIIDESKEEELKKSFSDFLKKIPDEIKIKINNEESFITINSGCSPEKIIETGIESGRGVVYNNKELATERAKEGFEKIVKPILEEVGLSNAKIKYNIPENGINKNKPERYVNISIEDEINIHNEKITDKKLEEILNKTKWIISDQSPSMNEERSEVTKLIKKINEEKSNEEKLEIIKLDAGYNGMYEQHLKTIRKIIDKIDKPLESERYIIIYTDEPDYNSDNKKEYESNLQEIINEAKEKNIEILLRAFNPKKPGESILKTLKKDDLTKTDPRTSEDMGWYKNISS